MNAATDATEVLLSQEIESLASCIARGQAPDSYRDIIAKVRGHAEKLPADRREFWAVQMQSLGVTLFPKSTLKRLDALAQKKSGTTYADHDREPTHEESRS